MAITSLPSVLLLVLSAAAAIGLRRSPPAAVRVARTGAIAALVAATIGAFVGDDALGGVVAVFAIAMGVLVGGFASRSLAVEREVPRFFVAGNLLVAATVVLATATAPLTMALGWVAVSGSTLALVASSGRPGAIAAARHAATRMVPADLLVVGGLVGAGIAADGGGSIDAVARAVRADSATIATLVGLALVVGAACRSALVPFHGWLVGSVAAPTPVSAMLHAGVVNGSAILLIRWYPVFTAPVVVAIVALGLASVVIGMAAARTRPDVKGGLAFTTVAQMGFMTVQCGLGLFGPAVVHMIGHGLFKSSLFLGSSSGLDRGPAHGHPATSRVTVATALGAAGVAAGAVAAALAIVQPHFLSHPAAVVPVAFTWTTVAMAVAQWWAARGRPTVRGIATTATAATVAATAATAMAAAVDTLTGVDHESVAPGGGALAWGVVVVAALATTVGAAGPRMARRWSDRAWLWFAAPRVPAAAGVAPPAGVARRSWRHGTTTPQETQPSIADARRARIAATVDDAAAVLAPSFPLERFVATNPLLAFENLPHEQAVVQAAQQLAARTEQDEVTYRTWHRSGRIRTADLRAAVHSHLAAHHGSASAHDVEQLVDDLLYGPPATPAPPRPVLLSEWHDRATGEQRAAQVDEIAGWWCARYLSIHTAWPMPRRDEGLWAAWRHLARFDARPGGPVWQALLALMPERPDDALARLLVELGVDRPDHRAYLRRHLVRHRGWASGLARSIDDGTGTPDDLVAYLAIRLTVEATLMANSADRTRARGTERATPATDASSDADRLAIWRDAYERSYRDDLLAELSHAAPVRAASPAASPTGPAVQSVFCIDARSEGIRRHLEQIEGHSTVGFAGFFGLTVAVHDLDAPGAVPSCPVILQPDATAVEVDRARSAVTRARRTANLGAAHDVFAATKRSTVTPFALAEAVGWWSGVSMAARTFAPSATASAAARCRDRIVPTAATTVELTDGWTLDDRIAVAASVLTTTGLATNPAPLVLLCGHRSRHVNNLHRAALDCGACGGRGGGNNARLAAQLLNDPDVRAGLLATGIRVPSDTWFVAGEHDTTADVVTILDRHLVPDRMRDRVEQLERDLAAATAALADERAGELPTLAGAGSGDDVRRRGADWAQVVPEWGLAGNAALVVGPRSLTTGHDLGRRAFLHTYAAESDPDGATLAAILGGPMMVAHWISSQYRFSTIDPEALGAGSKPLHNFVEGVGVIEGADGDLRLGLPLESVAASGEPVHEPMRLLVVVDAPASVVDAAVDTNPALADVVRNRWVQLVARPDEGTDHGQWVAYGVNGRWEHVSLGLVGDDDVTSVGGTAQLVGVD